MEDSLKEKRNMREIKFRAVRLDTGEWIYGDLHLRTPFPHIHSTLGDKAKIDTNTIGQFTGLKDGTGKEVYEGDIIKVPETEFNIEMKCIVLYNVDGYCVKSIMSGCLGSLAWSLHKKDPAGNIIATIIGNIHDNPELLK